MKIAASAYPLDWHATWDDYGAKLERWVSGAAEADLILFPEYAGLEAAMIGHRDPHAGTAQWLDRSGVALPAMLSALAELSRRHDVHILAGSGPCPTPRGYVNRAHFLTPDGRVGFQDKQILTPWERAATALVPGEPMTRFDTDWGRIGVLICYDSEFPLLARALDADLLLVPSCTEARHGATRVRLAARTRALEGQRYAATSPLVGAVTDNAFTEMNRGRAGLYAAPDTGFPADGKLAEGQDDAPGWVIGDADLAGLPAARSQAHVAIPLHWPEQLHRTVENRGLGPIR